MYTDFFGLTKQPFELGADPRYLYLSPAHARARAYLLYALQKRDSIVTVTGQVGTGKTTLIAELRRSAPANCRIVVIHQTQLDELELLRALLLELGDQEPTWGKARTLQRIRTALIECYQRNEHVMLVVDDAQNLSVEAIEELRMLADDELGGHPLLGLILVGHPSLEDTLARETLRQVRQRVRLDFQLRALNQSETRDYIRHRLRTAGCKRPRVFSAESFDLIHRYTGGVPRRINMLCDMALTAAAQMVSTVVTPGIVADAIDELKMTPKPAGRGSVPARWLTHAAERAVAALRTVTGQNDNWAHFRRQASPALRWLGAHRQLNRGRERMSVIGADLALRCRNAVIVASNMTRAAPALLGIAPRRRGSGASNTGSFSAFAAAVLLGVIAGLALGSVGPNAAPSIAVADLSVVTLSDAALASVPQDSLTGEDDTRVAVSAAPDAPQVMTTPRDASTEEMSSPESVSPLPPLDADWLMAQAPDKYTIQIIGLKDRDRLATFARGHAFEDLLAQYTMQRDGKDFFVLVQGIYSSLEAARTARAALPDNVRIGKPWIRRLGAVQDVIRATPSASNPVVSSRDPSDGMTHYP